MAGDHAMGNFGENVTHADRAGLPQGPWPFACRAPQEAGTLAAGTFLHLTQRTPRAQDGRPETPGVPQGLTELRS